MVNFNNILQVVNSNLIYYFNTRAEYLFCNLKYYVSKENTVLFKSTIRTANSLTSPERRQRKISYAAAKVVGFRGPQIASL